MDCFREKATDKIAADHSDYGICLNTRSVGTWKGDRDFELLAFPDFELFFASKMKVVFVQELNVDILEGVKI